MKTQKLYIKNRKIITKKDKIIKIIIKLRKKQKLKTKDLLKI